MAFFDRFKRKPKPETAAMGFQGQPLEVISGTPVHPDHHDKVRNSARIAQIETAIRQFCERGQDDHEMVTHLKAELARHHKIREVFHCGEEA
jgi:hypothetical protein